MDGIMSRMTGPCATHSRRWVRRCDPPGHTFGAEKVVLRIGHDQRGPLVHLHAGIRQRGQAGGRQARGQRDGGGGDDHLLRALHLHSPFGARRFSPSFSVRTRGKLYGPGGAAEQLGVKPSTLASRMKSLGIEKG
jgi:hypothetical protein